MLPALDEIVNPGMCTKSTMGSGAAPHLSEPPLQPESEQVGKAFPGCEVFIRLMLNTKGKPP